MIVSLDCSTLTLSLALLRVDKSVVEERFVGPPQRQSEILPEEIEKILKAHSYTLKDVSAFVVGLGPGSFTGLRIGLAAAKGVAYALKVPITGASSLAALALDGPRDVELFSVAVVKKGEFYVRRVHPHPDPPHALAQVALRPSPSVAARVVPKGEGEISLTLSELAEALKSAPTAKMIGPALTDWRKPLENLGVPPTSFLDGPLVPSAVALARLATIPSHYDPDALFTLEPHYIRGSGAEENPKFPPLPGVQPKARLKED